MKHFHAGIWHRRLKYHSYSFQLYDRESKKRKNWFLLLQKIEERMPWLFHCYLENFEMLKLTLYSAYSLLLIN